MYNTSLLLRTIQLVRASHASVLVARRSIRPLATAATSGPQSEQQATKFVGSVPHELLTSVPVHPTTAYAIRDRGYEDHFYRLFPSLRPPVPITTARNAFLKLQTNTITELKELERLSKIPETKRVRLHDLKDRRFANSITFSSKLRARVNNFLEIPEETLAAYLPEGFSGRFGKPDLNPLNGILCRIEAVSLVNHLLDLNLSDFPSINLRKRPAEVSSIAITGTSGVGKSATLSLVALWARMNNWLVFFVPNAYNITNADQITPSRMFPGLWDQLAIGHKLLSDFRHVHSEKLAQLPIRFPTSFGTFAPTSSSTLLELVSYGIENNAFSCDVVHLLRRELSVVTEFPVLVAVDDYNCFFANSAFVNPLSQRFKAETLHTSKLTLAHILSSFEKPFLRGVTLVATTSRANNRVQVEKTLPKRSSVPILPYNKTEFQACVKRIEQFPDVEVQQMTKPIVDYLYLLTGGVATEVSKYILANCHFAAPFKPTPAQEIEIMSKLRGEAPSAEVSEVDAFADEAQYDSDEGEYTKL